MRRHILRSIAAPIVSKYPSLKEIALAYEDRIGLAYHSLADVFPGLMRPRPYLVMIAITAHCNARCLGCNYGRDFMPGKQLPWSIIKDALDDAKACGFRSIRFYGGEPLLHRDLSKMIEYSFEIGLRPFVTTNAILLGQKIDDLYRAGLRNITIGFYGLGQNYDDYVQRPGTFRKVENSISTLREKYGSDIELQMNWLLMKPTCSPEALQDAWDFAVRYDMTVRVDLIHYSLPYFQEGPDHCLQFEAEDRAGIEEVTERLIKLKRDYPTRIKHSLEGLRSIPDWLIKKEKMRVPCTAYDMIWIGADGTVQLCYVLFKLGNLYEKRLRDMIHTPTHVQAARDAYALNCPNCHCSSNERVMRHGPSRNRYSHEGTPSITDPSGPAE